jgi:uncharacterized protein (TIGR02453 family)
VLLYVTGAKALAALTEADDMPLEELATPAGSGDSRYLTLRLRTVLHIEDPASYAPLAPIASDLVLLRRWQPSNWTLAFAQPLHLLTGRDHNVLMRALRRSAGLAPEDGGAEASALPDSPHHPDVIAANNEDKRTPMKPIESPADDGMSEIIFTGLRPAALDFFEELAFHQSRDWFQEHRATYELEVRQPLGALVAAVSQEMARQRIPISGHPLQSQFRLHRDIRFSKDKSPFKTHAGAVLTRDGAKGAPGILYLHLDPKGCFAAAGFWHPEPALLAALRLAIRNDPAAALAIRDRLRAAGLEINDDDMLTRLPRGYEDLAAEPIAPLLRMRSFTVHQPLTEDDLASAAAADKIAAFAVAALPLLRFGWTAQDAA